MFVRSRGFRKEYDQDTAKSMRPKELASNAMRVIASFGLVSAASLEFASAASLLCEVNLLAIEMALMQVLATNALVTAMWHVTFLGIYPAKMVWPMDSARLFFVFAAAYSIASLASGVFGSGDLQGLFV